MNQKIILHEFCKLINKKLSMVELYNYVKIHFENNIEFDISPADENLENYLEEMSSQNDIIIYHKNYKFHTYVMINGLTLQQLISLFNLETFS